MTSKSLSQLSDVELIELLKTKQESQSWTVGQLYELERRGFDLLKSDPPLLEQLEKIRDKHIESIKKLLGPITEYQQFIDRINRTSHIAYPRLEFPTRSLQGLTGPISQAVSELEIAKSDTDFPLAGATLENLTAEVRMTNKLLTRDVIFWIIAVSTLVSAITSIWILALTVKSR